MPGHRTHDILTAAAAAVAVPAYWLLVPEPRWHEALTLSGSCLVSGLLFSPDLDLPSRPRQRWGPAAVLWWPYEVLVAHRSWVSHHAVAGPLLRLAYFFGVLYLVGWSGMWVINHWVTPVDRNALVRGWRHDLLNLIQRDPRGTACALVGFVLGGTTHTVADVVWSRLRRRRRRGQRRR